MRITLTLDPGVAEKLRTRMRESSLALKEAGNQALRQGLGQKPEEQPRPFRVEPHSCGFKAGVDLDKLNQLADDLETEALARKLAN